MSTIRIEARLVARALFYAVFNDAFRDEHYPHCPICGRRDRFAMGGIGNCHEHGPYVYAGLSAEDRIDMAEECQAEINARGGWVELPEGFMFSDLIGGNDGEHLQES